MYLGTILTINPTIIVLLSFIVTYLRLNFLKLKKYDLAKNTTILFLKKKNILGFIEMQLKFLFLIKIFLLKPMEMQCVYFQFNNINFFLELTLYFYFYLLITILKKKLAESDHWASGVFITFLTSSLILYTTDLLILYLLIELNSYLFIFISLAQLSSSSNNQQKSIVLSTIVNFILNFYSSLFFFLVIFVVIFRYSNELYLLTFAPLTQLIFFFFFLLKINLGPWLYFGGIVYKGFRLSTLLFYSMIYIFVIFPKFLIIFDMFRNYLLSIFLISIVFIYSVFILFSFNFVKSVKLFLTYSTSILSSYVLLILSLVFFL